MTMEDKKEKYEPPRAMRLDNKGLGRGLCYPGSGDSSNCVRSGSNAGWDCLEDGNSAIQMCDGPGSGF